MVGMYTENLRFLLKSQQALTFPPNSISLATVIYYTENGKAFRNHFQYEIIQSLSRSS